MEFKQNDYYIIRGKQASNRSTYMKIRVLEITDQTILVENLDADCKFRNSITDFKTKYEVVEKVNQPIYKEPLYPQ